MWDVGPLGKHQKRPVFGNAKNGNQRETSKGEEELGGRKKQQGAF